MKKLRKNSFCALNKPSSTWAIVPQNTSTSSGFLSSFLAGSDFAGSAGLSSARMDSNVFTGFAGLANYTQTGNALGGVAYYILHLPQYHPGSTYTIQASIAEHGNSVSSNGKVYLPNWN